MPFCTTCGDRFSGRGSYCAYHSRNHQNYYSSLDGEDIRYRTTYPRYHHGSHKPLQLGFSDSYDTLQPYNLSTALSRYSNHNNANAIGYNSSVDWDYEFGAGASPGDSFMRPAHLKPLTNIFIKLPVAHDVTHLTYSVESRGTRSITATANPEREQCPCCHEFFPDRYHLSGHYRDFPFQCEDHEVCLRWDDVGVHAEEERHERCFVRGCPSEYRKKSGWRGRAIEYHVRRLHV